MNIIRNNIPNLFNAGFVVNSAIPFLENSNLLSLTPKTSGILQATAGVFMGIAVARKGWKQLKEANDLTQRISGCAKLLFAGGFIGVSAYSLILMVRQAPIDPELNAFIEDYRKESFHQSGKCFSGISDLSVYEAKADGGSLERLCTMEGKTFQVLHKCWPNGTETAESSYLPN